ncbi:MAG: septum formation family protein [Gordonia sp. (in: high G+C Gram-positive bacteria)]|uniref:septum formation family protein n=1 Tax=Gordonia sp. (in: high G+C Gram-positive bacteria) TaxID=84139 RepID=UPI0039E61F00
MTSDDENPVSDEPTTADAKAEPGRIARWRTAAVTHPLRVVLSAGVIGAVAIMIGAFVMGVGNSAGRAGNTKIGTGQRVAQDAFTTSAPGDCLEWPDGKPGTPTKVDCGEPHKFEVAAAVDGKVLPGGEFSADAKWPGPERFAALRVEHCPVLVSSYLNGRYDPQGRFVPNLMFPSEAQWDHGQRDLRCGLVQQGTGGHEIDIVGKVADLDQSPEWPPGTCIGIDVRSRQPTFPVNCAEPHAFQTTGIIDMSARFGNRTSGKPWPGVDAQNKFLTPICPVQAHRFMVGKRNFDKTTLNIQWSTVSEIGWLAGSRKAVCYMGLPFKGGFATLVGDARRGLLINGKIPTPPPAAPPGRALPTPVPLPPGYQPNPAEEPAPAG